MNITKFIQSIFLMLVIVMMNSCTLIEDIFAAGFWAGIIGVIVVLLIIFGLIRLFKSMGK